MLAVLRLPALQLYDMETHYLGAEYCKYGTVFKVHSTSSCTSPYYT